MVKVAKFVGLDVHKKTISIAVVEGGPVHVPRSLGTVVHDIPLLLRLLKRQGKPSDVQVAYEAGPTGYGLYRRLRAEGFQCFVVAPSKTPVKPGDRVKTDRRDAATLAHHLRSNSLTPIEVPDEEREALRDLLRAREDAVRALRAVRQQLDGFLLRQGRLYEGRTHWTKIHWDWIRSQRFSHPAQRLCMEDYIHEVLRLQQRVDSLVVSAEEQLLSSQRAPLFKALQAMRGVSTIVAATLVVELGDLRRFPRAPKLMSFVGLVPSEYSSGEKTSRGSITKAGNAHVRRVLIEAAQCYRHQPQVSTSLKRRQKGQPLQVIDIAWKAQKRLHRTYHMITSRRKSANYAIVAMARELVGFLWAIGQHIQSKQA